MSTKKESTNQNVFGAMVLKQIVRNGNFLYRRDNEDIVESEDSFQIRGTINLDASKKIVPGDYVEFVFDEAYRSINHHSFGFTDKDTFSKGDTFMNHKGSVSDVSVLSALGSNSEIGAPTITVDVLSRLKNLVPNGYELVMPISGWELNGPGEELVRPIITNDKPLPSGVQFRFTNISPDGVIKRLDNSGYIFKVRAKAKSDIDRMIEDYGVMPVIIGYTQFVDANGSSDGGGVYKQEYALALLSKGPAPRLSGTNPPDVSIKGFGDLHTLAKVGTGNTDFVVPQGIATIPMCHNYKANGLAKLQEYMDKKRIMYYFIDSAHENATVGKETRFGKTVKFNVPVNRDEFPREDIMEQIHEEFYRSGLRNYPSVLANEVVVTIGSDTYTIPKDDLSEVFMYYFQDWFMLSNPKVLIRQDIGSDPQDRYKKFLGLSSPNTDNSSANSGSSTPAPEPHKPKKLTCQDAHINDVVGFNPDSGELIVHATGPVDDSCYVLIRTGEIVRTSSVVSVGGDLVELRFSLPDLSDVARYSDSITPEQHRITSIDAGPHSYPIDSQNIGVTRL